MHEMFVIYKDERGYRVGPLLVGDGLIERKPTQEAPDLETARAMIPRDLIRVDRHPSDAPEILESWV